MGLFTGLGSLLGVSPSSAFDGVASLAGGLLGNAGRSDAASAQQAISLEALLELNNYPLEQVLAKKKISALVELSVSDYKQMIAAMNKAKEKKE